VAVTVVELTELATEAVYEVRVGENVSFRLPPLIFKSERVQSDDTRLKRVLNFIPFLERQDTQDSRIVNRRNFLNITVNLTNNSVFFKHKLHIILFFSKLEG